MKISEFLIAIYIICYDLHWNYLIKYSLISYIRGTNNLSIVINFMVL